MNFRKLAVMLMVGGTLVACDRLKQQAPEETSTESAAPAAPTLAEMRAGTVAPENIVWSQQHMSELFPSRTVSRGGYSHAFPKYNRDLSQVRVPLGETSISFEDYLDRSSTQGIVVLHKGTIIYERYFGDAHEGTRFTTWSVAKSINSTLIGMAIKDGYIKSVNDRLTDYIPELAGTAYDGVTIAQTLQMSSGVDFNEEYDNPENSDIWGFMSATLIGNEEPANQMAASYPRGAEPGTVFNYNTAETQVLGWLLKAATGQSPAHYLETKLWKPLAMDHDATWLLDSWGKDAMEMTGCCLNAALRDWARFGQFILDGGQIHGKNVLPEGWIQAATTPSAAHLKFTSETGLERGYQYQWWSYEGGRFAAEGVFGQFIFIDPEHDLVIAKASTWPVAWDDSFRDQAVDAFKAIAATVQ
ncbi:MAG: class C beta-lactamase-related serine hydrolase [Alphaproteobacteria bacterium]|nr:MAG: class C beta-lactamase-related serine hydrolase [Alphaproteobacteria bacterium]